MEKSLETFNNPFRESLGPDKRLLGIDFGKKYVGVAISDPLFSSAQGLEVVKRPRADKLRQTLKRLEEISTAYEVGGVVIGFPKNMDGSLNERCQYTIEFADLLFQRLRLPIYLWDERLSTQSSQRTLTFLGKKDTKTYVDMMAAMLILQSFMDGINNGNTPRVYKEL